MAKTRYSYKYNGQVVRNSNRLYLFGLVNHKDHVVACSGTEQGVLSQKIKELNYFKRQLEYCKKHKPEWVASYETDVANIEKWYIVKLEVIEN